MQNSFQIHQVPILKDNYVYVIRHEESDYTAVVDPGLSQPVIDFCQKKNWSVNDLWITHHHWDHTDGIAGLVEKFNCKVYGHDQDQKRIPLITNPLSSETTHQLGPFEVQVLNTPGHTIGHICYYLKSEKVLFCGDTLFSLGCGRLFEGTPEQMLKSLRKIRSLPSDTTFYCTHEYTLTNTKFALQLQPEHSELLKFKAWVEQTRDKNQPTVPALLEREILLNPLLRWDDKDLKKAVGKENDSDLETFTRVRQLRNQF